MRFRTSKLKSQQSDLMKKQTGLSRNAIILGGAAVLVLGLGIYLIAKPDEPAKPASEKVSDTSTTSTEPTPSSEKASSDEETTSENNQEPSAPAPANPPKTPSGNFVSNHKPALGSTVLSTCLTTPAAKCNMSFTKDGVTKSLGEKTADSDGAVYWTWKPKDMGLSAGTWKIVVTATNGDQSATATDEVNLEVSP